MAETLLKLPRAAIPLLFEQRCQYRPFLLNRLRKWIGRNALRKLEVYANLDRVERLFGREIQEIYASFAVLLPSRLHAVLDIGAGLGGIDIIIYQQHGEPTIWLLDKDGISPRIRNGYHASVDTFANYNSFALARDTLVMNGVRPDAIKTVDIGRQEFPNGKFDLICSFLSWGFHYPIETYLDQAHSTLSDGGLLILDLRAGKGGRELLERRFGIAATVVYSDPKFERVAIRKAGQRDPNVAPVGNRSPA